jgi:hypothetical protein
VPSLRGATLRLGRNRERVQKQVETELERRSEAVSQAQHVVAGELHHPWVGVGASISARDEVEKAIEDRLLARHVVVDRHRLDAQLVSQPTDRQRLHPMRSGHGGRWTGGAQRQGGALLLPPYVSQRLATMSSREDAEPIQRLADMTEAGSVVPAIDRIVTLDEVPQAMRDPEQGLVRRQGGRARQS